MSWYAVGALAAALTSFGFVPQVWKMWRNKSAKDVSGLTLLQFGIGVSLWTVYGMHLRDPIVIAANLVALATVTLALTLVFRYAGRARKSDQAGPVAGIRSGTDLK